MDATFTLRYRNDSTVEFLKPAVMGVINISPNSFYNPSSDVDAALACAEHMIGDGADMLDVGGEATNPFVDIEADGPSLQQELDRVVPVIQAIKKRFDIFISVDTSRPQVMREVVSAGADMINDQRALAVDDAVHVVSELKVPVCLMHFFNPIRQPGSSELITLMRFIKNSLRASVERALAHGITPDRIIIDPGFGGGNFGKSSKENYFLLANLHEFTRMGFPVLTGWSRKSMIGDAINAQAPDRLYGSIAADTLATLNGSSIIRTHDVKAISDAIKVTLRYKEYV